MGGHSCTCNNECSTYDIMAHSNMEPAASLGDKASKEGVE